MYTNVPHKRPHMYSVMYPVPCMPSYVLSNMQSHILFRMYECMPCSCTRHTCCRTDCHAYCLIRKHGVTHILHTHECLTRAHCLVHFPERRGVEHQGKKRWRWHLHFGLQIESLSSCVSLSRVFVILIHTPSYIHACIQTTPIMSYAFTHVQAPAT